MFKKIISILKSCWVITIAASMALDGCKGCGQKKDTKLPSPLPPAPIIAPSSQTDKAKSDHLNNALDSPSPKTSQDSNASSSSGSSSSGFSSGSHSSGSYSGSDSSASVTPQPFAGLPNVGNTCYMNAVLQIIAAVYADKVEPNTSLGVLINKINNKDKPLDCKDVKQFIHSLEEEEAKKMAESRQQHDPDEFIYTIKDYFLSSYNIKCTEYRFYKKKEESGGKENIYKCNDSSDVDPPYVLQIPIVKTKPDLSEMIKAYQEKLVLSEEGIAIDCDTSPPCTEEDVKGFIRSNYEKLSPITKDTDKATGKDYIKQRILTLPSKLYIKLERSDDFRQDNSSIVGVRKNETPITGTLNITITPDPNKQDTIGYELMGFILHSAYATSATSATSGHYVAYVKREGKWYKANDKYVNEVDESDVRTASEQAYLLFYKKQ